MHGSVLVQDGTVYFAAGRSRSLDGGIRLCGLDAATGRPAMRTAAGRPGLHASTTSKRTTACPWARCPTSCMSDGTTIYMRDLAFDEELKPAEGQAGIEDQAADCLDDSYFKRMPWTLGGEYCAADRARQQSSVYYVRMFDSLRGLDPTVFFTPGRNGYLLFSKNAAGRAQRWSQRVRVRIRAMALGRPAPVRGRPARRGRSERPAGCLRRPQRRRAVRDRRGLRASTSRSTPCPRPPVFNGTAAARGQLYVATEDGRLTGFGKP